MELDPSHADPLADGSPFAASAPRPDSPPRPSDVPKAETGDHNVVFTSLVTGDKDIVGLVAYSIYKQNKYDWLMAFSRQRGRMPNHDETLSYLYGESTPRRLATYRNLAEATLDGRGLEVPGATTRAGSVPRSAGQAHLVPGRDPTALGGIAPGRPLLIGGICLCVAILGLVWFFHGGPAPR